VNDWQITKQMEANWQLDREIVAKHNQLENVIGLLSVKVEEASHAILQFLANETDRKDVLQELSDVGLYLMALFRLMESDMLEEIREKSAYNCVRFNAVDCQKGEWVQVYPELKERAKQQKLKQEFYE